MTCWGWGAATFFLAGVFLIGAIFFFGAGFFLAIAFFLGVTFFFEEVATFFLTGVFLRATFLRAGMLPLVEGVFPFGADFLRLKNFFKTITFLVLY